MIKNSKGTIFYGMHFYPGVAEYAEPGQTPFRIFVNEDTIRGMNPSFAGRPIFVEHVDEVDQDIDELKHDADGWVIESFFNAADGKHWAKFIVVSDRGLAAISRGYKLSNAYVPVSFGPGGQWNGVAYDKEVTAAHHEHLAIVKDPRYQESQILTPEQFKVYNSGKEIELKRLANSQGETVMKLNLFKRKIEKIENGADIEAMSVTLPKSGVEKTIIQIVNEADDAEMKAKSKEPKMANADDMFALGDEQISVGDLAKRLAACEAKMAEMMKNAGGSDAGDEHADIVSMDNEDDAGDDMDVMANKDDDAMDAEKKKAAEKEKGVKNAADKEAAEKAKAAKLAAFERLKNAHVTASEETAIVEVMADQVTRGRQLYGSG